MIEFSNDDEGYLAWLTTNPNGYVLNVRRLADPNYVVLHRATCGNISTDKREPGAYTARGFRKVCATSVTELQLAAKREGRTDGSFSKRCGLCGP
jgi:hypothetical protein